MEQERILDTLKAAVAYQLLDIGVGNGEVNLWHPTMTKCIKRMIDDSDYRAVVLDCWSEVFEHHNGEMFEALKEMMEGTKLWEDLVLNTSRSALPMGGIPPTSKS